MEFFSGALSLNIAILTFLALFVFLKNKKSRINQVWALSNIMMACWFLCIYLGFFTPISKPYALAIIRIAHYLSLFTSLFFYHFVLLLTERSEKRKGLLRIYYSLSFAVAAIIILFPKSFLKDAVDRVGLQFVPLGGPLYFTHTLVALVILASICYELIIAYRESTGYKRNQTKYVLIGTISLITGGATIIPVAFGINIFPFGFFFIPLYGIFITYALVKYRLMDINILISKTLFSIFILAPVIVFQVAFASLLQSYGVSYFISNSLSLLIIFAVLLFTPLAYKLQQAANSLAFRGRYDYQNVLRESTRALVTILELSQLLDYIIKVIVTNLNITRASLLLEDEEEKEFRIEAAYGIDRELRSNYVLRSQNGIISYLKDKPRIFISDEMRRALSPEAFKNVYGDLYKLGAEVIIPLIYKNELKGVLNLDSKSSGQMYNQADLDILESLSAQAAVSIENARLYRKAITDSLTRLYHHDYFMSRITKKIEETKHDKRPISLLMMDLDYFKEFNDKYGHQLGDLLLKNVARIIMSNARRGVDIPARYGGEEFALLLSRASRSDNPTLDNGANHLEATIRVAERIREKIAGYEIEYANEKIGITISIGLSLYDGMNMNFSAQDLIGEADKALYKAKMEGRNRVCLY